MLTDPTKLAEFDEVLSKWKEDFKAKASAHCPQKEEHEEWFDLVDMKYDGWSSFTYRVTACCKAFEILVLQAATEERMFNPPRFDTGVPVVKYETEMDHRSGAVADRVVTPHEKSANHEAHGIGEVTRSQVERCFDEIWSEQDIKKIKEWVSADCKVHTGGRSFKLGPEPFEESVRDLFKAVPDLHVEVKYHVVEHDKASSVLIVSGTPTTAQKRVEFTAISFSRWHEGKIIECWNLADLDSLLLKIRGSAAVG